MKKLSIIILLFARAYQVSSAQTIVITGTVTNDHQLPLHYAFVQDKQLKNATYTDSTGMFTLTVSPTSQLLVSAVGYTDATADIANHTTINVSLKTDPSATPASTSEDAGALQNTFKTKDSYITNTAIGFGGAMNSTNETLVTGSRFLFPRWVHGYVVKANGEVMHNSTVLYNYDKMEGDLYLTADNKSVLVADKNTIKYFTLFSPQDEQLTFERMTGISEKLYSQVLSSGPKYKIYKLIKTSFEAANYKSDGVYGTGHKDDEYTDDATYYLLNLTTNNFAPLSLKKKAIKEAFAADADKLNAFMAANNGKIDDAYLKSLGDAVNK